LIFPKNHFDFVVSSGVLQNSVNIVQVLREAKRVLKPGGQFIAIREPVWPLVKLKSRSKMVAKLVATGVNDRFYTLADYKEFFKQAGFPLEVKRVNLSRVSSITSTKWSNGLDPCAVCLHRPPSEAGLELVDNTRHGVISFHQSVAGQPGV